MSTFTAPKLAGTPTWFDLQSPDVAKAREFYTKLFGWTFMVSGPEMGYYSLGQLNGQASAGIAQMQPGTNMPSAWSVYLATDDIQADTAKWKQLGGQVFFGPDKLGDFGHLTVGTDPTGAVFGLWQAGLHIGATITEVPGAMAWCEEYTHDVVKARDFYCAMYNLTYERMQGMEYYVLHRGQQQLAGVMQMDKTWPDSVPSHWMPYFAVANADDAAKLVIELGGKLRMDTFDSPHGRLAWVEDPFGAAFFLVAMTAA